MSRRQPNPERTTGKLLARRRPPTESTPQRGARTAGQPDPTSADHAGQATEAVCDGAEAVCDGAPATVIGLSAADIAALTERRQRMLANLEATEHGRELVRRADQQVDQAGQGLADDIRALARTARGGTADGDQEPAPFVTPPSLTTSRSAAVVLNELASVWQEEVTRDLQASRSPWYRRAQDAHRWMDAKIRFQRDDQPRTLRQRILARHWGTLGNAFTFAAAIALFWNSAFGLAAALILARILITTAVWAMSAYPSDDSPDHPVLDADPRICVLGHAGDMLLFSSFAATLANDGRIGMAFAVILAAWGMILGTLLRIAATSHGFPVPRLHLERVVRGGSTLAAVSVASIDQSLATSLAPLAIIVFPTVFAFIEGQEALRALSLRFRPPTSSEPVEQTSAAVRPVPVA
jgi:hypothetical protein